MMDADDDPTTVWIGGNNRTGNDSNVHVDGACHRLEQANNVYGPMPFEDRHRDRLCDICSGLWEPPSNGDTHETRRKMEALDPEDVGLSPIRDGDSA